MSQRIRVRSSLFTTTAAAVSLEPWVLSRGGDGSLAGARLLTAVCTWKRTGPGRIVRADAHDENTPSVSEDRVQTGHDGAARRQAERTPVGLPRPMRGSARQQGVHLHRPSFAGSLHRLRSFLPVSMAPATRDTRQSAALAAQLLRWIAGHVLPDRPNRYEPRRRKRRPKEYSLLTQPRRWYHLYGDDEAR